MDKNAFGYFIPHRSQHSISKAELVTRAPRQRLIRGCLGLLRPIFFRSAPYFLAKRFQLHILRGCLGLLHELCFINSAVEQLHKKLELVEYLFRCSHSSTLFSRTECVELKAFG